MFSFNNQWELRKVTLCSLISCMYIPNIVNILYYNDQVYSVGKGSSFHVLAFIFLAELLKVLYLNSHNDLQGRRPKPGRTRVSDFARYLVFLLFVMFCFFVGVILFGAPFLEHHEETLMLSALLTMLVVFPLAAYSGIEMSMQLLFGLKNYSKDSVTEMLIRNALFTVSGAWLGAVVIPLDWGRKWQEWPIPCYFGAIAGYLLSNVLTLLKVTLMFAAVKYPSLNMLVSLMNKYQLLSN